MSLLFSDRPLAYIPSPDRRQYVPWLTAGDREIVGGLDMGPGVMVVAHALADAVQHPSWIARPVRSWLKLGLLLEPELYLLQLPPELRQEWSDRIELLLAQRGGEHIDLERPQPGKELRDLAQAILDLEVRGLATAFVAPTPLLRDGNLVALTNALKLYQESERYYTMENLTEAADDSGPAALRRPLLAAINLDRASLRDGRYLGRVLDQFSEARGMYAFFVQVANMGNCLPSDVRALTDFLYTLRERTGVPVIPARLGPLGLGYLAGALEGYACGIGAAEYLRFPCRPPGRPRVAGEKQQSGFALVTYNHVLLRNMRVTGPGSRAGLLAFHRIACDCGAHPDGTPPYTNEARKKHTLHWRLDQARRAVDEGAAWLLPAVARGEAESLAIDGELKYYAALRETLPPDEAAGVGDGT